LTGTLNPVIIHTSQQGDDMREYTSKLIAMMDEGLISAEAVAEMALAYMSEDDVKDMCRANDLLLDEEDEEEADEEEWTPDNADFCDPGSRHHY
jgi:hypothetical protein